MKLLIIVLCLLSERFLIHKIAFNRFYWFANYRQMITAKCSNASPWLTLAGVIVPLVLITGFIVYLFSSLCFGLVGFVLSLMIFYYCLGPVNPFYPTFARADMTSVAEIGGYLVQVNQQLFALIFWFVVSGPIGALIYRLVALCCQQPESKPARIVLDVLDWIPVRITGLLYLLVGNFQTGFHDYSKQFLAKPAQNHNLLKQCGLQAFGISEDASDTTLPHAEKLVEQALIVFLVLIAIITNINL